ncbi:MAG TPA: penicillin-binding protein 2 [Anaerolinea thermolimosa]|uniref:Penicillin-binding protein 2 n=1 Tax=Anaerolinea thermolimosa TaxID=229919 RepID=A0A3D1JHL0_9CHLR|nr:penicillin-binding protein 2 [Anaerolinea thermolimosa]GAP07096.1 cell division protein FtsI/penicillin-binding protein 2 [Anaerolinea thermolimosa]HCE18061.1 penicillin-binding protein 2 [Anaerolinea thermolimosa]
MRQASFFRFWFVGGLLSAVGLFIFFWMIRINLSPQAEVFRKIGSTYETYRKTIYPERGNIYDRWGHLLAGNVETYEIGVDLRFVSDPQTIAATLAQVVGLDYNTVYDSVSEPWDSDLPRYVKLADFIDPEKIDQLDSIEKQLNRQREEASSRRRNTVMPNLDGLIWTPMLKRSYPEHTLGSNVIGFYAYRERETARGYFGVEEKYNQLLAGTPVEVEVALDPYKMNEIPSVPPGASLMLTLDRDIQAMSERILDKHIESSGAKSGVVVVMDPETGEILAMAVTPRLDPNEYWKYSEVFPGITAYNRAIGTTYEPGSVFKVLTMAAALDAGVVQPSTPFLDTGVIMVGGVPIRNWDRGAWGPQDMIGCMQHSLNVCLAWVATQLGPSKFYNYLNNFGIGHLTGVDLGGEASQPFLVPGDNGWYEVNLGTNSFGQGIAATPIQMITAISAVANHGKMMAPHVLKAVIENGEQYSNPPQIIGKPISAETAETLTNMLATSLEEESSAALVDGYRVAGKTGTAEIPGPGGYLDSATNASFVGWGPVDDPRFIVYVWLEQPQTSPWGSVVAAPLFKEIVENLVILMDLPPDSVRQGMAGQ